MADVASIGGRAEVVIDFNDLGQAVARGIRPHAIALALVAALVAIAGACILGQTLMRQSDADAADRPTLTALGMSRRGLLASAMWPAGFVAVVAAVTAAVTALSASLLTPIASPARSNQIPACPSTPPYSASASSRPSRS